MPPLASQSYVFDPRPNYPLLITAKRYWKPSSPYLNASDALTLVFAHATGFHKEHYEPTIQDLYNLIAEDASSPKIREVWSIDCPNHGDAAVLNEETLRWGYEPICSRFNASPPHQKLTDYLQSAGRNTGAPCICFCPDWAPVSMWTSAHDDWCCLASPWVQCASRYFRLSSITAHQPIFKGFWPSPTNRSWSQSV